MHILLEVPSTDYLDVYGELSRPFLAPQRVGLSFWPYLCAFYSKVEFAWFCVWQSIVFIKQRIFPVLWKYFILG